MAWIDDSKATNVGAAVNSVNGVSGPLVLIAGPDVVRMAPSLVIDESLVDEGLQRFERAVAAVAEKPAA